MPTTPNHAESSAPVRTAETATESTGRASRILSGRTAWLSALVLAAVVFAIDQGTKYLVVTQMQLAMAQKVHDDYVAQGEKAKAELLDEAEKKADALVSEARQQREEVLARLTDEKEELEIAVEALRGFESRYRTKLLDHLNNQVEELKNLKSIEASA